MAVIVLYGTEGCHLCDEAEGILLVAQENNNLGIMLDLVDIMDDEALFKKYQYSIPVVENKANGKQLFWPFNVDDVLGIL